MINESNILFENEIFNNSKLDSFKNEKSYRFILKKYIF